MIRAGAMNELHPEAGHWVFADIGFAQTKASCGFVEGNGVPEEIPFNALVDKLAKLAAATRNQGRPLHVLIEAPLPVAFTQAGNTTGRSIERGLRDHQDPKPRLYTRFGDRGGNAIQDQGLQSAPVRRSVCQC